MDNFYSLGEGYKPINDVVRLGDGFGITYKTYDTVKKRGMTYELMGNSTRAYYERALGNSTLKVDDLHMNFNFIFPFLMFYTKSIDQTFSVGLGIGTLAERDYLDENNNLLPHNSTNLKEINFGKYWESSLMLDYEISFRWSKRIGINLGLRYLSPAPIHSNKIDYDFSLGTGLAFKYGMFYQFK